MTGPVITIARQLGSGGEEVAAQVAERLGIPLLDHEIISRAAQEAGVSEQALRSAERASSMLSRMLENLGKFGTAGAEGASVEGLSSVALLTTSSDFRALLERVLRDVALSGPAVIIGHAAQVALRDTPGTLHCFVHAPMEFRTARHARAEGISLQKAQKEVEDSDRERVKFFQTSYHINWYDLRLYDVVVDTQILGIRGSSQMIAEMAKRASSATVELPALPREPAAANHAQEEATTLVAVGDERLRVRPMTPADAGALLALFRSLEPTDLLFLRKDVTDERTVDAWARDVADGKIITLLAEDAGGNVLGEASLYPSELPWTRHVGEVRVVTSPEARGHGLGRALLQEIMQAARAAGLEKLTAEMTVEQASARRLFEGMGFVEEGRYRAYARDQEGTPHDLLVMTHDAG